MPVSTTTTTTTSKLASYTLIMASYPNCNLFANGMKLNKLAAFSLADVFSHFKASTLLCCVTVVSWVTECFKDSKTSLLTVVSLQATVGHQQASIVSHCMSYVDESGPKISLRAQRSIFPKMSNYSC